MENIYIVFIEYDNDVAKISPIKCSFKNIIDSSIDCLKKKNDIYYYNKSNVTKIIDKDKKDKFINLIKNRNNEINLIKNRNNEEEKDIVQSSTISFIIIISNHKLNHYCYVINCEDSQHRESIGSFTHINKNIKNLISNLKFNIDYNNKSQQILPIQQEHTQPAIAAIATNPFN
jgi:hypothetical protein